MSFLFVLFCLQITHDTADLETRAMFLVTNHTGRKPLGIKGVVGIREDLTADIVFDLTIRGNSLSKYVELEKYAILGNFQITLQEKEL